MTSRTLADAEADKQAMQWCSYYRRRDASACGDLITTDNLQTNDNDNDDKTI